MARHVVELAAFLVEAAPQATALHVHVLQLHTRHRADASERVDHRADDRPIAPADDGVGLDRGDEIAHLLRRQHRRLADLDRVPRAAHRRRRIDRQHLADHEPVEQGAQRGEPLLHGLRCQAQLLDVGGDVHGLHRTDVGDSVPPAPAREVRPGLGVCLAGVRVPDVCGEELDRAAPGLGVRGVERREAPVRGCRGERGRTCRGAGVMIDNVLCQS